MQDVKDDLRCQSTLRVSFFAFIDLSLLCFFKLDLELLAQNKESPLGLGVLSVTLNHIE